MINKTRIKIGIVVVITCVMCFSNRGFAVDEQSLSPLWSVAWLEGFIVNVLSWAWVLLAKLAGEFLTNKWVYGELLGLDALFWQYWNITKNMANFCLGAYFIFIIFKGLVNQGKENVVNVIKNKILWILIAGVGIQISWFFTAAMVDVSTITLVAAGSLPAQVISSNEKVYNSYKYSLAEYFDAESQAIMTGKYMELFDPNSESGKFVKVMNVPLQEPQDSKAFFDALLPSADTVSGPLYYMGFAILEAHKVTSIDASKDDGSSLKGSMLNLIIMGGTTIVYALELFVLCVLAMMRIIYLWMFIVLSPFAIFLWCLQMAKDDKVLEWSFVKTLMKQIKLKSFFINIFKPTIIVIGLSLATIFASLMRGVLVENAGQSIDLGGITIQTKQNPTTTTTEDEFFSSTMDSGVIKLTIGYVGKGLLEFIISIITVILVYVIINFAVKFGGGEDFVSDKLKKVQETAGGLFTSLPVMPVAGFDKSGRETTRYMSMGQVFGVNGDMKSDHSGGLLGKKIEKYQGGINDNIATQNNVISSWFKEKNNIKVFKTADQNEVIEAGKRVQGGGLLALKAQLDKIRELGARKPDKGGLETGEGYGMTLDPNSNITFWRTQFENWLTDMVDNNRRVAPDYPNSQHWNNMIFWWRDNKERRTLEDMFRMNGSGESASVKTYVDFFGLDSSIKTWNDLIKADISEKKEEKKKEEKKEANKEQNKEENK